MCKDSIEELLEALTGCAVFRVTADRQLIAVGEKARSVLGPQLSSGVALLDSPIHGINAWVAALEKGDHDRTPKLELEGPDGCRARVASVRRASESPDRVLPMYLALDLDGVLARDPTKSPEVARNQEPQKPGPPPKRLSGKRILVAEDGPDNQKLIRRFLEKDGADTTIVENGQLAVDAALEGEFDLVLMDMQMPVLDGQAAVRQLRARGFDKPIVALTAYNDERSRTRCLLAGCSHFMPKPISRRGLTKLVRTLLDPEACGENGDELAWAEDVLWADPDFRVMVTEFINDLTPRLHEMEAALERGDWERLETLSHRLKGAAGGFGLPEITTISAELERLAKAGAEEDAGSWLLRLRDLVAEIP